MIMEIEYPGTGSSGEKLVIYHPLKKTLTFGDVG